MIPVKNIFELPPGKRTAFLNLLAEQGFTPEKLLMALDAPIQEVRDWIGNAPGISGISYDAVSELGFGASCPDLLPVPTTGEVILRVGNWSLCDLWNSEVCNGLTERANLPNQWPYNKKLFSGIYRLRLPVPHSNRKTTLEQETLLQEGEAIAPIALVATAMLVHLNKTGGALLKGDHCRCAETDDENTSFRFRSVISTHKNCVRIGGRPDRCRNKDLWLAACKKIA